MASSYMESLMNRIHMDASVEIPISYNNDNSNSAEYNFKFSNTWFADVKYNLLNILKDLVNKEIKILEIGTFEGQSTLWFLTNLCTHPRSHITTIDRVQNEQFKKNVSILTKSDFDKLTVITGQSAVELKKLSGRYDIIYIDGSHFPDDVLEDAVLSFQLLKYNGLMIFDDYLFSDMKYLDYITNQSQELYKSYYTKPDGEIILIYQSINMFASIYAPRLKQLISANPSTAVFKKISDSFNTKCKYKCNEL